VGLAATGAGTGRGRWLSRFAAVLQKRGFGCWPKASNLWLRPAPQFHEARSLCQSRHATEAAVITIAVAKAPNNATITAMIATKVSVIDIRRCVYARLAAGNPSWGFSKSSPFGHYREAFKSLAFRKNGALCGCHPFAILRITLL